VAASLALGARHSCAVLNDGSAVCWGDNTWGELGIGSTTSVGVSPGQMGGNLQAVDLGAGNTGNVEADPPPFHPFTFDS
jgi:E3 ubiquitin-protein ligase HERC3